VIVRFGPVAGWVTCRIPAPRNGCVSPSDVATGTATIGGAAVTMTVDAEHRYRTGLPRAARACRPVVASTATAPSAVAAASTMSSDSDA